MFRFIFFWGYDEDKWDLFGVWFVGVCGLLVMYNLEENGYSVRLKGIDVYRMGWWV